MRTLLVDVETSPNTAHVWGLWQQNVSLNQLMESSRVMCWAAKWLDEKVVLFDSEYRSSHKAMLKGIHSLLSQADTVIHYNGTKFDIPTLNKEFLVHGLGKPAPFRQMDLLRVARQQFKFASNRLDYVAQALEVGQKTKHEGHELWVKCMHGDPSAWARMERYNKNDVVIMQRVYEKLLPWMTQHTNHNAFRLDLCCPNCESVRYQKRGHYYSQAGRYQRYQCQDCATWFRSTTNEKKGPRFVAL